YVLEHIEDDEAALADMAAILKDNGHVCIFVPALPGRFRFLTPRMVGFQADQALPKATRFQVTLKAGLADLSDHQLEEDLAWTFNTEPIKLTNLPGVEGRQGSETDPLSLEPTLEFTSNTELDLASMREHLTLKSAGQEQAVPIDVDLEADEASDQSISAQEQFNPATRTWAYTITPQQPLEKATSYQLKITPGLRPAQGNLASENAFESQVVTYAPLAFQELQLVDPPGAGGAYGRFVKGRPQLYFNNGLVATSAVENITVQPAPKQVPQLIRAYEGDSIVGFNPWALEPATKYTITLGADLEDKFGQTLGQPVTMEYDTGDVAADLWVPSDLNIFPADQDLQLNIATVNLPESEYKAAFAIVQPTDLVYTDSAYPRGKGQDLLPPPTQWSTFPVSGPKNQENEVAIPLQEKLGAASGMLAYGVQARTNTYESNGKQEWREPNFYGLVQLTNLGVFAQWFPESGAVRVHHLSDGAGVEAAQVEIYQSKLDLGRGRGARPCATGQTDPTGTLRLSSQALQQCRQGGKQNFAEPPELLVIAREQQDWAFVRTQRYSGDYGYGIYAGWDGDAPESRGIIFSDRQLYQPGETVWLTGAAYYLQNSTLQQDKNVPYTLTLEDPEGNATDLGTQTTNEFGTFSLELPIAPNQPLGYYAIRAQRAGDGGVSAPLEITGEFRVAEFKPPNFRVDLTLDQDFALIGQQIEAQAQSNYLFGPPVEGGNVEYYVTREPTQFTPPNWEQFSFGRKWYWPEEQPTVPSDVLQVSAALNERGQSEATVTVARDLPYPMTYRVDAEVVDVSNLSVSDAQTFTALPSDRLIGLQSDFVADADKPFPIQVIVTNPEGEVITGQRVRLELQQMSYSSVTQVVEGSPTARDQVEYKTVDKAEVRSGKKPKSVQLTPPESGSYRIRANFANTNNELTATDTRIWATGTSAVYWGGRYRNNRLEIKLDKASYQPGEIATALIQSPYPEAELYFSVIRHDTLYQTVTQVEGGAPQIQFEVTPEMLPNAAVEAVLVRQGPPLSQVEPESLTDLVQIGFTPFATSLDDQYLQVEITDGSTAANDLPPRQPGDEQTLELTLKDALGQPVQGQFTVMVVNESILQLNGYRPPDLVETVYAEQPISTRFADNRSDVVLSPLVSPLKKGWGYGGGLSAGGASTRVRQDFRALAYYNGSVLTDAAGKAQVTFTLPDDLTTWRVMVVATDGNLHFGDGETTFITTKPLVTNPLLPQFARLGDRLEAGLTVTNTARQKGTLAIQGELSNGLQFLEGEDRASTRGLEKKAIAGTRAYRFPVVADRIGQAEFEFTTELKAAADAFKVPLAIKPLMVTEQVVETGATSDQTIIPLNVATDVATDVGGLELNLASTLISEVQAPVQQILQTDLWPCLETAASQLAIAANLQILVQQYEQQTLVDFEPTKPATQALETLQQLQRPDGGLAAWPLQERSDPFVTAYAARSLARATTAGFTVDADLLNRLKTYLQRVLANPGQYDFCQTPLCKNQVRLEALTALAALGDTRNEFLADLYEQRNQFDYVDQIKLARYLFQFPNWQPAAETLANQLQETLYETGRSTTVNLPRNWRWFNSATTTQAQALQLFVDAEAQYTADASGESSVSPLQDQRDRLLQGLLNLRREGTWPTLYDNAQALTALVDYAQLQPTPPAFKATAQLADKTLVSTQFEGDRNPRMALQIPMADLPTGKNDLTLQKTGQGILHYLAAYRYRLQGNQPGRLNGLRVTREIRPANQADVLHRFGLNIDDDPVEVKAGQVFDIGLEIITDHPVDHLIITDPLPAGFEAVDTSFQTSTSYFQAQQDSWEISYQKLYRDRILAYGDRLEAGVYSLHYLVRSVTPGIFLWPGAEVHLQYAPEEFGRSASSELRVIGSRKISLGKRRSA
ncbi:MAG: alpha-2-macroglobulin family protein, partial [Cyanothece sp. SIO1E1]|nr:alpha-2-macroglobulin family protein [Cyanothece sp. SIO1E1]